MEMEMTNVKITGRNWKMAKSVFKIYKIRVITTPNIDNGGYIPSYKVYCKYALFYNSAANYKPTKKYTIKDDPHSDFFPYFNRKA